MNNRTFQAATILTPTAPARSLPGGLVLHDTEEVVFGDIKPSKVCDAMDPVGRKSDPGARR